MLQRLEAPCPGCRDDRLVMEVSVNDNGSQFFPDGQVQRKVTCDHCGTTALVTLQGAGRDPTVTRVPMPPQQNQESRRRH